MVVGAMQRHHPFQIVGEFGAMLRLSSRERVAREVMGVAEVVDARQKGANMRRLLTMPPTEMPPKPTP